MRIQTLAGVFVALAAAVLVAYLSQQNTELIQQPFRLTETVTVPLYAVIVATFLLGFLPVVSLLVVRSLKQDLAHRRQRRFDRETRTVQVGYRRAVDLQVDEQWTRAAVELEAVLADQPEDFPTLLRFGQVLRRLGRVEEAIEVHRRASVLYPQSVAVLYELAEDYDATGSTEVAREIRDRILRDFPGLGMRVLLERRDAALASEDWITAERLQESMDALSREDAARRRADEGALRLGLTYQRGVRLLAADEQQSASDLFRTLVREAPEFLPARIMLGEALLLAGEPQAAVEVWRQGWEETGSAVFLQRIEDHFIEVDEPLTAIMTLRQIISRSSEDLLPRFFLAKLYARLEMHDEALKVLTGLQDSVKDSADLSCFLGRLHERRGDSAAALEAFRSSMELAGLTMNTYACASCGADSSQWRDRCARCGAWGTIDLRFDVESVADLDRPIHDRPVWPVYGKD